MNHDYAHCLDYTERCPKKCFRGELVRDLKEVPYPLPVSWMHLKDTEECIMNDLKPCPFCGGEAEIIRSTRSMVYEEYRIGCSNCGAMVKNYSDPLWKVSYFDTEEEAIEAWNRRAEL